MTTKDLSVVLAHGAWADGSSWARVIAKNPFPAEAKDDPSATPVTMVQWLRFGPGRFLHMFGLARTDVWQSTFMRMRTLRDGIEPK